MALKDLSEGRTDQFKIDPRKLQIKEGWNSRDMSDPANTAHIEELSKSIAEVGVKRALVVTMEDNIPYVIDGECRYRATMLAIKNGADIKTVPVVGEDRFANDADRLFGQILYNSGKPLTVIEQGKVFKRLLGLGWAQKDIASKAGLSGGRISQILEIQTLPVSLQQLVVEGKVSATMALNVYKKFNGDLDKAYAELMAAIGVAASEGRTRAMPKDSEGEGEGSAKKARSTSGTKGNSLKKHIRAMVERAYADQRIDDTENMVTMSIAEDEWAELMEMIDY